MRGRARRNAQLPGAHRGDIRRAGIPQHGPAEFDSDTGAGAVSLRGVERQRLQPCHIGGNASIERSPQRLELACSKGSAEPLPIGPRWLLQDFPPDANDLDDTYNLRLQLWGRLGANSDKISELVLAFRGTEARHGEDWWANLRWFLGPRVDHYTLTSDTVAPALQTWIEAKITAGVVAPDVKLVTTGHSLGGGLAQRMAYAFLTPNGRALRVHHVYAFDPSPVTGWFSVEKDLRERNVDGMQIDRILEDGEALSYVRTLLGIVVRPTEKNPAIRGVKFNFKHSYNPLSNHSMRLIGCSLAKYAFPSSNALDTQPLEQAQD